MPEGKAPRRKLGEDAGEEWNAQSRLEVGAAEPCALGQQVRVDLPPEDGGALQDFTDRALEVGQALGDHRSHPEGDVPRRCPAADLPEHLPHEERIPHRWRRATNRRAVHSPARNPRADGRLRNDRGAAAATPCRGGRCGPGAPRAAGRGVPRPRGACRPGARACSGGRRRRTRWPAGRGDSAAWRSSRTTRIGLRAAASARSARSASNRRNRCASRSSVAGSAPVPASVSQSGPRSRRSRSFGAGSSGASARSTWIHGQRSGAPPPSQAAPHATETPRVAAPAATSSASRVFPMPGSPETRNRLPRPESSPSSATVSSDSSRSRPTKAPPIGLLLRRCHGGRL